MEKDTILYVLTKSKEYLEQKNIPNPRLDAEVLLSDSLQLERIKLYSNFDRKLSEVEKDNYRNRIKSRADFKPVAYITNKKAFYKSIFYVNESVLIPRPETEELVEWCLSFSKPEDNQSLLDLGTGSGCIGISIQLERPNFQVEFSDISESALEIAKQNIKDLVSKKEFVFYHSDLFDKIDKTYSTIISNPPYIPLTEKESMMEDVVGFEPHTALFVDDILIFHRKLFRAAKLKLNTDGNLFLETHPDYIDEIAKIALEEKFTEFTIKKDYSNKKRFLKLS
jgi:release factor glutamine methyltransferase